MLKNESLALVAGADEASIATALARERLAAPGLRVVISDLKFDPTRPRGPLAPDVLRRYLAEKFARYRLPSGIEDARIAADVRGADDWQGIHCVQRSQQRRQRRGRAEGEQPTQLPMGD